MTNTNDEADREAIRMVIARQFSSLSWNAVRAADWDGFSADFLPGAQLFPAARPVRPVSVPDFVARMKTAAASTMPVFEEALLGIQIRLYGKVAVALAVCGQRQREASPERAVEALLLLKEDETWRIAAQGWDKERDDEPIPEAMLD